MALKLVPLSDITVTTAGTRVQVSTNTALATNSIVIEGPSGNTGSIYVGDSTVSSSKGIEVQKGTSITITGSPTRNSSEELFLSDIWVDAATNGDKVKVAYLYNRQS